MRVVPVTRKSAERLRTTITVAIIVVPLLTAAICVGFSTHTALPWWAWLLVWDASSLILIEALFVTRWALVTRWARFPLSLSLWEQAQLSRIGVPRSDAEKLTDDEVTDNIYGYPVRDDADMEDFQQEMARTLVYHSTPWDVHSEMSDTPYSPPVTTAQSLWRRLRGTWSPEPSPPEINQPVRTHEQGFLDLQQKLRAAGFGKDD